MLNKLKFKLHIKYRLKRRYRNYETKYSYTSVKKNTNII